MNEQDEKLVEEILDQHGNTGWNYRLEAALREAITRTRKATLLEAAGMAATMGFGDYLAMRLRRMAQGDDDAKVDG